jgi:CBS domain-containing protein
VAQKVADVMTREVVSLQTDATMEDAARQMKSNDVGAVVIVENGDLSGVVTDRDIVVRGLAEGADPKTTPVSQICSGEVVTVSPEEDLSRVVRLMREKALRRIVVTSGESPVGILSLGDLAVERDPDSVLADISDALPNQ